MYKYYTTSVPCYVGQQKDILRWPSQQKKPFLFLTKFKLFPQRQDVSHPLIDRRLCYDYFLSVLYRFQSPIDSLCVHIILVKKSHKMIFVCLIRSNFETERSITQKKNVHPVKIILPCKLNDIAWVVVVIVQRTACFP